jgi:hypothetical protein
MTPPHPSRRTFNVKAPRLSRRLTLLAAVLLSASTLGGCATTGSYATNNTTVACGSFKPIWWSRKDTVPTQKQVIEHNAAGKSVCGWKPRKNPYK